MPPLLLGAQGDQCVTEQLNPQQVVLGTFGRSDAGELLVQDHLFENGKSCAAVLFGPGDRDQPGLGK